LAQVCGIGEKCITMTIRYFVYVKNFHGQPEAQIWFGEQFEGGKPKSYLARVELKSDEGVLGINALSKLYPFEGEIK
jgi:hypothetical protein